MPRGVSAGCEHEEDVALARELVEVNAPDRAQAEARGELRLELGVAR